MLTLLLLACAHHIPAPTEALAPLSPAPPASGLAVCRVDFAKGSLPKGMVIARGHVKENIPSVASGLLFLDPRGNYLLDGGYATDFREHIGDVHGFVGFAMRQSTKSWVTVATPADAVRKAGGDPATLTGLIASHGHYDHLGGLLDLPGLPVWTPAEEIADAEKGAAGEPSGELPAEAKALLPRAHAIPFNGPAVGPWPRSWDVYGDGSVLIVPMPGHTPGSVGTLVRLPDGRRMFHVGDTVWVREGYETREPKSWIAGAFDSDADQNDLQIQRLWQLHQADPDLIIVPAHDSRQWDAVFGKETCLR